ncbi:hypothetical protein [Nocardia sp. R6R-6]|uniref:hypothetical protein n=1 Tax=Nocardia sp. R6R-6 TaxID=3459303 RepID=UPI00403DEF1D
MQGYRGISALTLAAGALALTAPIASAVPIGIPPARTLCGGGGAGAGMIAAQYDPARNSSDNPTLWIHPDFVFVPDIPGGSCGVEVTVHWQNSDTGALGSLPPIWVETSSGDQVHDNWVPITIPSGLGRTEVLIATNYPHVPGKGTFVVT